MACCPAPSVSPSHSLLNRLLSFSLFLSLSVPLLSPPMAAAIHCVILGGKSRCASPHVGTLPTSRKGLDSDTVTFYSSLSLFPILLFLETPSDFINVGVEQTLKVIQIFFFVVIINFFFLPSVKRSV